MSEALHVLHDEAPVGALRVDPEGGLSFRYDDRWLASGFAISLSLPLDEVEYGVEAHRFFVNLLPEGAVRRHVARRLGISEENDWELLRALGGDCAGALALLPEPAERRAGSYEDLPVDRLREIAGAPRPGIAALGGDDDVRLSLAGAQDKLPVRITGDGDFQLPRGAAASTHIVKFHNPDFAHLPANEVLVTSLARRLELPAVYARLDRRFDPPLCILERYDRATDPDGRVVRRHQEDFCQALGLPFSRKYEREGGPGLAEIHGVLERNSPHPAGDTLSLLRWTIFNLLVGNSDAHAKNVSLLYENGVPSLAPFYDLVSTAPYRGITRRLAMSIGGEDDPGHIRLGHWQALAEALGVTRRSVVERVETEIAAITACLEAVVGELRDEYGEMPIFQMVVPEVRRQLRRTRRLLHP